MTPTQFQKVCKSQPGAHMTINWGDNYVWKVFGKMFAIGAAPGDEFRPISFKAGDIAFEMLPERKGLIPAPYLQRAKWIQVQTAEAMEASELEGFLIEAHAIIVSKLSKKRQSELGM